MSSCTKSRAATASLRSFESLLGLGPGLTSPKLLSRRLSNVLHRVVADLVLLVAVRWQLLGCALLVALLLIWSPVVPELRLGVECVRLAALSLALCLLLFGGEARGHLLVPLLLLRRQSCRELLERVTAPLAAQDARAESRLVLGVGAVGSQLLISGEENAARRSLLIAG